MGPVTTLKETWLQMKNGGTEVANHERPGPFPSFVVEVFLYVDS